jgi:hypothetical protein
VCTPGHARAVDDRALVRCVGFIWCVWARPNITRSPVCVVLRTLGDPPGASRADCGEHRRVIAVALAGVTGSLGCVMCLVEGALQRP